MHDFAFRPEDIVVTGFGTQAVGPTSLTLFSYLHFFTYAHRSNPQPHQLEAFRLADRMNLSINGMLIVGILIATVVGAIAACWAYLHTAYQYQGSTWPGWPHLQPSTKLVELSTGDGYQIANLYGGRIRHRVGVADYAAAFYLVALSSGRIRDWWNMVTQPLMVFDLH